MTSYSKTATTIELYDVPRSIAEDHRIAYLQSNLFRQVSCAKSKTKACTEISAWTICPVRRCLFGKQLVFVILEHFVINICQTDILMMKQKSMLCEPFGAIRDYVLVYFVAYYCILWAYFAKTVDPDKTTSYRTVLC